MSVEKEEEVEACTVHPYTLPNYPLSLDETRTDDKKSIQLWWRGQSGTGGLCIFHCHEVDGHDVYLSDLKYQAVSDDDMVQNDTCPSSSMRLVHHPNKGLWYTLHNTLMRNLSRGKEDVGDGSIYSINLETLDVLCHITNEVYSLKSSHHISMLPQGSPWWISNTMIGFMYTHSCEILEKDVLESNMLLIIELQPVEKRNYKAGATYSMLYFEDKECKCLSKKNGTPTKVLLNDGITKDVDAKKLTYMPPITDFIKLRWLGLPEEIHQLGVAKKEGLGGADPLELSTFMNMQSRGVDKSKVRDLNVEMYKLAQGIGSSKRQLPLLHHQPNLLSLDISDGKLSIPH